MTTRYNHKFLVHDYEFGEEAIVAAYDSYREAELYIINRTIEGSWTSMEIEQVESPTHIESEYTITLRLKLGWHSSAYHEEGKLKTSYPQKVWAVVQEDCRCLPIQKLDKKTIRATSFISPNHSIELLIKNADQYLKQHDRR